MITLEDTKKIVTQNNITDIPVWRLMIGINTELANTNDVNAATQIAIENLRSKPWIVGFGDYYSTTTDTRVLSNTNMPLRDLAQVEQLYNQI